ncbi:uncharacterized protein [Dermacentor andersoni]|uniref:uncharacterized protein n=1 Tax=Dermacentor andersoni TaxID=34620 RepID=UPI00215519E6|nr:uncharacterized protein LOC126547461 [Dermacentor andersoni]
MWHGERASTVHQTSPSEFGLLLKASTVQQDIPAAPGKLSKVANWPITTLGSCHLQCYHERKSTAAVPTLDPTVYLFSGRKGTVMQVFVSSAMVEAERGRLSGK